MNDMIKNSSKKKLNSFDFRESHNQRSDLKKDSLSEIHLLSRSLDENKEIRKTPIKLQSKDSKYFYTTANNKKNINYSNLKS